MQRGRKADSQSHPFTAALLTAQSVLKHSLPGAIIRGLMQNTDGRILRMRVDDDSGLMVSADDIADFIRFGTRGPRGEAHHPRHSVPEYF